MAAEKVGSIYYSLDLDDKKFNKGADDASNRLNRLQKGFKSAEKGSFLLLGGLTAIGIGLIALGGSALKAASDFETMDVALLTTFQGNQKAADSARKAITKFSAQTPFQLNEVLDAFIKLKNLGLDPSEEALTSYGNTASAMGKSLSDMIEAVADASTGEFERLKEFGIRARVEGDKVKFTFQGVTTEIKNDAESIEGYLMDIGKTKFAGGMEKQSKTLSGRISTLKDNFNIAMVSMAKDSGLLDTAKKVVDKFILALEGVNWDMVMKKIQELTPVLIVLASVIAVALVPAVFSLAAGIWATLAPLLPFIAIGAALGLLLVKLSEKFGGWSQMVDQVKKAFSETWQFLSAIFMPALNMLKDAVMKDLVPALVKLWNFIKPVLIPILKVIAVVIGLVIVGAIYLLIGIFTLLAKVIAYVINTWINNFNKAKASISGLINVFKALPDKIKNALSKAADGIKNAFQGAFDWLFGKLEEAALMLDKINPFHKESPSLIDKIRKGSNRIIGLYDNMFSSINSMSLSGQMALAGAGNALNNSMSSSGGEGIARAPITINVSPRGIIARSRGELREIGADMINAVNEGLRSRGIKEIGEGKIIGSSTV